MRRKRQVRKDQPKKVGQISKTIERACEVIEAAITRILGNKIQFNKEQQLTVNGSLVEIRRLQLLKKLDCDETKGKT